MLEKKKFQEHALLFQFIRSDIARYNFIINVFFF